MKLYTDLSAVPNESFKSMLDIFYPVCHKVSIYFPNEAQDELLAFKEKFLAATQLCEIEDELAFLEPKEGFSMVIASITSIEVQSLLKEITAAFHLSFGLIKDETLVFFLGEEGEIAIDIDDMSIVENELFSNCTKLND